MFCSKCGKEIEDTSTFCKFCGAPVENAASAPVQPVQPVQDVMPQPVQNVAPQPAQDVIPQPAQNVAPQNPQYGAPQAPQYGAPQAPQYGAPQNPQFTQVGFSLNLEPNVVDIINKILRGAIALVALLVLIGSIGTMASTGYIMSNLLTMTSLQAASTAMALYNFMVLLRVASIITFVLTIGGGVFTFLTKQGSLFSYISAGLGLLIFIFHFILFAAGAGGVVALAIFLMIFALALIGASVIMLLNKEDIIKFKPKF